MPTSDELLSSLQRLAEKPVTISTAADSIALVDLTQGEPKPSGKVCKGIAFHIPNTSVQFEGFNGNVPCGEAYYRYCMWDSKICPQQVDGEPCSNCDRQVQDRQIGALPNEYLVPVHGMLCYLDQVKQWVLVEVPVLQTGLVKWAPCDADDPDGV